MKADFFITYHHNDELAARWIPERGCWAVYDNDINNTFPFPVRGSIPR